MHIEAYDIETLRKIVRSLQKENKSLKKKLKELNIPFENIFPFEETFERKWNKCGFKKMKLMNDLL